VKLLLESAVKQASGKGEEAALNEKKRMLDGKGKRRKLL
jgi:hypothetical protein